MSELQFNTTNLKNWLARVQAGDKKAREELLASVSVRFEKLTRRMLRKFPGVERWEQSDDVFQNAMLRLLAALETVNPENTRAFVGLCTEQIRRELIDLARHYGGRRGIGANHDSFFGTVAGGAANVVVTSDVPAIEVELWATFHEEMTKLPPDEREVVGLVYYHNWAQSEIGELLGVDERTVRRRLKSGLNRLREAMRNLGLEDVPDD